MFENILTIKCISETSERISETEAYCMNMEKMYLEIINNLLGGVCFVDTE